MRRWLIVLMLVGACGDDASGSADAAPSTPTRFAYLAFEGVTLVHTGALDAPSNTVEVPDMAGTYPAFQSTHPERESLLDEITERYGPANASLTRPRVPAPTPGSRGWDALPAGSQRTGRQDAGVT